MEFLGVNLDQKISWKSAVLGKTRHFLDHGSSNLVYYSVNERVVFCAFRVGTGFLLLFVSRGQTAVQSTRASWSPWEGYLIVL